MSETDHQIDSEKQLRLDNSREREAKQELEELPIPKRVYFLIAIAMVMTSFASILIRYAGKDAFRFGVEPANPSIIAFWRLLFATVGMFFGGLVSRNIKGFQKVSVKQDLPLLALSGVMLATHFVTWNTSLDMTNVASSITIVYLMPLFTILFATLFLKEKITWLQFFVMLITILGAISVGISDLLTEGLGNLIGDLFALAGGISGAAYYTIGRKKREKLDIFTYTTIVYGICTVSILIYVLIAGIPLVANLSWIHFVFFLLLAIGPSCLGHTLYNYSLGYIKASVVTIVSLGEMFGATLLAIALFSEVPHWSAFIGMALVAAGIVLTVILENKLQKRKKEEKNNAPVGMFAEDQSPEL